MAEMVFQALQQAGTNFLRSTAELVPRVVMTASIVIVGWLIAFALRALTRAVLARVGFGNLCERQGVTEMLRSADLPTPENLAGSIVFWIVWIGFLLSGVDVLGVAALQGLVSEFTLFVPRLLVGIVILIVGFVFANVAWRATQLAAVNAKLPSPRILSGTIRSLVMVLTAAMALDQIAVARTVVLTAFAITFGGGVLSLAIAFGFGGRGVARRILEHYFPERKATPPDEMRHL